MIREWVLHAERALGKVAVLVLIYSLGLPVQAQQDPTTVQSPADATAMVAFLLIFIGMIVVYILWIRAQQKKNHKEQTTQPDKT